MAQGNLNKGLLASAGCSVQMRRWPPSTMLKTLCFGRIEISVCHGDDMSKLCIFVGITVLGWIGWWIGARVGFMTAFILSCIGSIVGVFVGLRIYRDYLE